MNREAVRVLYLHELRMLLRDRRTVFLSIVLPLVLFPVTIYGVKASRARRAKTLQATEYKYAVQGTWAAEVRALLAAAVPTKPESAKPAYQLKEVDVDDPAAALRARRIHFYLQALSAADADALPVAPEEPGKAERAGKPARRRPPGTPLVLIHYQADRDNSSAGQREVRQRLDEARRRLADARLAERGFTTASRDVFPLEETNVGSAAQVTGRTIGRLLTVFVFMLMLTGGLSVSMDSIAGEKERGTLETLLTTAAGRAEIVAGKLLVILSVMLTITVIQLGNLAAYLWLRVIPLPADFVIELPPASLLALALLLLPLAAFAAVLLLTISGYSKSYKEAQLYFMPVYLLSLLPAAAGAVPGLPLRSAIVAVPIANVSVAVRDVLMGRRDWPMLLAVSVVMSIAAALLLRSSARLLSAERLIVGGRAEEVAPAGGPALFPYRVMRWYALAWVVIFTVAANVPELGTLRGQIFFNEAVILLLPLAMIAAYRLPVREALALRPVRPVVWLAIAAAVPSGHLAALGVFRLTSLVLPVSPETLEQYAKMMMSPGVPTWELYVLVAVLPGVCEELAFRGVLLYGLSRRLRPVTLVVAVSAVFALYHVSLFRLVPTAALGAVLTVFALLTGSVVPGIVAHIGNNALALWAGLAGVPLLELDPWVYVAATFVLGLCLWILYRTRTPYPGLRHGRAA